MGYAAESLELIQKRLSAGDRIGAIDLVYDRLQYLFSIGDFEESQVFLDTAVTTLRHKPLPMGILLSILTVTLPWNERIQRGPLYTLVYTSELGKGRSKDSVEKMLTGLQP